MNAENIAKALRGVAKLHSIEEGSMVANLCIVASDLIESLLSQLDAAIAGQEKLAESQCRERAARLEVCRRCPDGEIIDGVKHYPCDGCEWRGPVAGE